jgi:hypothetical protein
MQEIPQSTRAMRKIWRIWAKALGEKAGATKQEADMVALVRTLIILSYLLTNCFIIAGVIRHW